MRYRAEIDGLRAVAVIPVIFFHAGFGLFGGGFVGVDVFFVISGYLITSFISNDLRDGKFSLVSFYERRARRLLPALFFVMLACVPFAFMWLLPRDMEDFGLSLIAVAVFSSNILFWRQSGYFDAAAELKPLLHTWSLAVEEQYYILFPLFLMVAWRLGRRWIPAMLAAGFVLSLAAAQWGAFHKPAAAFYLLPTRGWEILLGALLALLPHSKLRISMPRSASQLGSLTGLVLIACATFAFDSHTPFPGLFALVPTVGAALVIVFAVQGTFVHKLLSHKALVGVGLISYSAYLWHHPLFAFTKYITVDEPGITLMLVLCGVTFLLAWLSWRFIETPFRNRRGFSRQAIFAASAAGFALFVAAGFLTLSSNGFASRYSGRDAQIIADQQQNLQELRTTAFDRFGCFFGEFQTVEIMIEKNCLTATEQPKIILFGDSEAAHFLTGMRTASAEFGYALQQFTGTSCRAIRHQRQSKACVDFYERFFMLLPGVSTAGDVVILASNWRDTFEQHGQAAFEREIAKTLVKLRAIGVNVLLIGNTPDFVFDPYGLTVRLGLSHSSTVKLPVREFARSDSSLRRLADQYGVPFFAPTEQLCNGSECVFSLDGEYLFFDAGHLSYAGSDEIAPHIMGIIRDMTNGGPLGQKSARQKKKDQLAANYGSIAP